MGSKKFSLFLPVVNRNMTVWALVRAPVLILCMRSVRTYSKALPVSVEPSKKLKKLKMYQYPWAC